MQKTKVLNLLIPTLSVLLAFLIGMIIILCLGSNPFQAIGYLVKGAFGSATNFGNTVVRAMPLLFTGLCTCFAYRCGVFNLGGEGQFLSGAMAAITVSLLIGSEGWWVTILAMLAGTVMGGLWGLLPGLLKTWRGLNEMITTIMFNYVAALFMGYLYTTALREGSVPQTAPVPDMTKIGRVFPDLRITWGIAVALVLGVAVWYFLFNTSKGFQLRAVGFNQTASSYNGLSVKRYMLAAFVVSGAIAGLGGACDILGTQFRLISGYGGGYGFDGVAIALIAQLHPIATMIVAYFFAVLRVGSTTMQVGTGVPTSVIDIIQALVIIFAVAGSSMQYLPKFRAFMLNLFEKKEAVSE
ncbi:MAG: D-allose transporter subunit [Firmicutes bacterium ADurb.Bin248]|nr:MAG: D-allose transporter subunit [Firmicutes bacterium ADurb.Bin248]HPK15232.1 ABC transporter permease [Clostridia bacterium]